MLGHLFPAYTFTKCLELFHLLEISCMCLMPFPLQGYLVATRPLPQAPSAELIQKITA